MWTDRKQDNFPQSKPSPAESQASAAMEAPGVVSAVTVIGKNMTILGSVKSRESLHIDGEIDGTLEMPEHRLTVSTHGRVHADVQAREVEVLGKLDGDIAAAKKITVRKTGRLIGDLRTPAVVIEEGA